MYYSKCNKVDTKIPSISSHGIPDEESGQIRLSFVSVGHFANRNEHIFTVCSEYSTSIYNGVSIIGLIDLRRYYLGTCKRYQSFFEEN